MSIEYKYIIPGNPVSWKRVSDNKYGYRFDTQKNLKHSIGFLLKQQHGSKSLFTKPLHVTYEFYFDIPKSWPKQKQLDAILSYKPSRGDADNHEKLVNDTFNGLIWVDDALVCKWDGFKMYDLIPRTEITVREL